MKTRAMMRAISATTAALALLLTGCVGYRLGSMLPVDIKTVYLPTFVNETDEPLIERETTSAMIEEIQKDGSLRIVDTREEADAILDVTLIEHKLAPVGFDLEKKTTANEYRLTITARMLMTRRANGEVIAESPRIQGETTFVMAGDLTSSKQQALPAAAEDLAHDLVESVVETWP